MKEVDDPVGDPWVIILLPGEVAKRLVSGFISIGDWGPPKLEASIRLVSIMVKLGEPVATGDCKD